MSFGIHDCKTRRWISSTPYQRREQQKKLPGVHKKVDIAKETVKFMRNVDYARLRNFDIKNLLRYEITSTSLFLTKDGFMVVLPSCKYLLYSFSYKLLYSSYCCHYSCSCWDDDNDDDDTTISGFCFSRSILLFI